MRIRVGRIARHRALEIVAAELDLRGCLILGDRRLSLERVVPEVERLGELMRPTDRKRAPAITPDAEQIAFPTSDLIEAGVARRVLVAVPDTRPIALAPRGIGAVGTEVLEGRDTSNKSRRRIERDGVLEDNPRARSKPESGGVPRTRERQRVSIDFKAPLATPPSA